MNSKSKDTGSPIKSGMTERKMQIPRKVLRFAQDKLGMTTLKKRHEAC